VKVLPAAKANWALAVQRILADEGCGCDVYSPGELNAALDAGVDPQFISVNGVPKDEAHIYRSIQAGARLTIDSVEEVDVIEKAAHELGLTAKCACAQTGPARLHRTHRLCRGRPGPHRSGGVGL
jgi:diaminopimelate decarboxylase